MDINGIFSTVTAGTHGYGMSNIIINDRGFANKSPQISYGICPTLRAENHGNLPKVIVNEDIQVHEIPKNGICEEDS